MRDDDVLRDEAVRECYVPPMTSRNPDDVPQLQREATHESRTDRTVD